MDNPGGSTTITVSEVLQWLQYDATMITKDSFKAGTVLGAKMTWWTRYNLRTIMKYAKQSTYMGTTKDKGAYQVGVVHGYIEEAKRLARMSEAVVLTLDDMRVLGVSPEKVRERIESKKARAAKNK